MSKWQWILHQLKGHLWVRASLFCVLGVVTSLAAVFFKHYIPSDIPQKVGADAVDNILQIIASSMLAVTTFSLSVMVAAYSAATSNATPRATQLMLRDSTAHNALSVFIGAFLFSLVGIIALSMGIYGDNGRLILFVVTILVIILIISVLLQWISYLSRLGRVNETVDLVESATANAFRQRLDSPYLGGVPLTEFKPTKRHHPVPSREIGYVQHIDMEALQRLAKKQETEFFLTVLPGTFADASRPLLYSKKALGEEEIRLVHKAFSIGGGRSFDQDPRFGMVVLSEIASRALSPAVNDPGTAIDIIGTAVRILAPWVANRQGDTEPRFSSIHVPPITTAEVLDDIYSPIIRDGAGNLQVAIRIQKALAALATTADEDTKKEMMRISRYALACAQDSLPHEDDKKRVEELAEFSHSGSAATKRPGAKPSLRRKS